MGFLNANCVFWALKNFFNRTQYWSSNPTYGRTSKSGIWIIKWLFKLACWNICNIRVYWIFITAKQLCNLTPSADQQSSTNQNAAGGRARALYDFTSDCNEELSLKVLCQFHLLPVTLTSHDHFNTRFHFSLRSETLLLVWSLSMMSGSWVTWEGNEPWSLKIMCKY